MLRWQQNVKTQLTYFELYFASEYPFSILATVGNDSKNHLFYFTKFWQPYTVFVSPHFDLLLLFFVVCQNRNS